jgi:hypothetical protein
MMHPDFDNAALSRFLEHAGDVGAGNSHAPSDLLLREIVKIVLLRHVCELQSIILGIELTRIAFVHRRIDSR